MKTTFIFLFALLMAGCGGETVKPTKDFVWPKPRHEFELFKNDITGEFYVLQQVKHTSYDFGNYYAPQDIVDGDSAYCVKFVREILAERKAATEEAQHEAAVKKAWHQIPDSLFDAILDSAEVMTARQFIKQQMRKDAESVK